MAQSRPLVSLGFTEEKVPAGTHICQIFSDDDERNESLLKFLLSGLQAGERAACFSEKVDEEELAAFLEREGVSFGDATASGAFTLAGTGEVYFQDNRFDPDRMLDLLARYHEESEKAGYPASRVIGEMTPEVQNIEGGSRLMEYESRVSMLLEEHPVTAVCQYDAHAFDGATIMDVLKVHPRMFVHGSVVHNPFYVPPEKYLESQNL